MSIHYFHISGFIKITHPFLYEHFQGLFTQQPWSGYCKQLHPPVSENHIFFVPLYHETKTIHRHIRSPRDFMTYGDND